MELTIYKNQVLDLLQEFLDKKVDAEILNCSLVKIEFNTIKLLDKELSLILQVDEKQLSRVDLDTQIEFIETCLENKENFKLLML